MEKFGIFNLISALTSFAGEQKQLGENGGAANKEPAQERSAETPQRPNGIFTAEQRAARCTQILERHERISRGIDRKNKT